MYMYAIYKETGLCEQTFFPILKKINVVPKKADVHHLNLMWECRALVLKQEGHDGPVSLH